MNTKAKAERTLSPMFGKILVEMDDREEQSEGGIIIPENARPTAMWGTVLAVASDVPGHIPIYATERVLITPAQGTHIRLEDHDYILIEAAKVKAKEGDVEDED